MLSIIIFLHMCLSLRTMLFTFGSLGNFNKQNCPALFRDLVFPLSVGCHGCPSVSLGSASDPPVLLSAQCLRGVAGTPLHPPPTRGGCQNGHFSITPHFASRPIRPSFLPRPREEEVTMAAGLASEGLGLRVPCQCADEGSQGQ